MANSRLSFVIAIKLATGQFNKATTAVKSQLLSLQRNFLAFASAVGAGTLGLTGLISKMVETAKETSRATIALKNVTASTGELANAQRWLIDLSKRYGVEINTLTTSYAKFKAAADISNMSLEDQRKVFESVARASVVFGLSVKDQKGVFMALQQMMSKNKVMAEELRLQLSERMPVAIQAMAKAAGVTVGELDSLMKQGKVLSSEVLPKFADALNSMIADPDTNNLNKSLIDLKNTFTDLTKQLNVEGAFKSLVDGANAMLRSLIENIRMVGRVAISIFVGSLIGKFANAIQQKVIETKNITTQLAKQRAAAEKRVATAELEVRTAATNQTIALQRRIAAEDAYQKAISLDLTKVTEAQKTAAVVNATEERTLARKAEADAAQSLDTAVAKHKKQTESLSKISNKLTKAEAEAGARSTATVWGQTIGVLETSFKRLYTTIKAVFAANLWSWAITAATTIATQLYHSMRSLTKMAQTVKELGNVAASPEATELDSWQSLLHHKDESVRKGALEKINSILGTQLTSEDGINEAIEKRQKLLLAEAKLRQAQEALQRHKETFGEDLRGRGIKYTNDAFALKERGQQRDKIMKAIADAQEDVARYSASPSIPSTPTLTPQGGGAGQIKTSNALLQTLGSQIGQTLADEADRRLRAIAEAMAQPLQNLSQPTELLRQRADQRWIQANEVMQRQRDKSGDWKLSDIEIKAADLDFEESRLEEMKRIMEEYGVDLSEALAEGMAKTGSLKEAIKIEEAQSALADLQKQMNETKFGAIKDGISDIDGIVNAFDRLNEAMSDGASGWEKIMAVWEVFSSVAEGIIGVIEAVAQAQEIAAQMEKVSAATKIQAKTGEAAAEVGGAVAKESGGFAALIAVPAAIAAIIAAFSAIPKFANGGIVGGTSKQGDKVLARLNSGEGVLTPEGLESLHDAANPRNRRNINVTGVLRGKGRELYALIETEKKYKNRIG